MQGRAFASEPLAWRHAWHALALSRVVPPGPRGFSIHEARDGDEHVEHAGVLPHAAGTAQVLKEYPRVLTNELIGFVDTDQLEIGRRGGSDVGQIGQAM